MELSTWRNNQSNDPSKKRKPRKSWSLSFIGPSSTSLCYWFNSFITWLLKLLFRGHWDMAELRQQSQPYYLLSMTVRAVTFYTLVPTRPAIHFLHFIYPTLFKGLHWIDSCMVIYYVGLWIFMWDSVINSVRLRRSVFSLELLIIN